VTLVLSTSWADEIGHPSYAIFEDLVDGVIRMRVEGFFDVATLKRHFAENEVVVNRWRSVAMPIRVFIDACDLKPHSPEGQACVQEATARIYREGDRVAVEVGSSLVKMQMRRVLKQGDVVDFFTSEQAALEWLRAG
jgi:tryptophanase